MLTYIGLLLALSSSPTGNECLDDHWRAIVLETEALIAHRTPVVIPPDGFVAQPLPACVRLTFKIDGDGVPFDIAVGMSSKVYPLDTGALRALGKYRFRPPGTKGGQYALVFEADRRGVQSP